MSEHPPLTLTSTKILDPEINDQYIYNLNYKESSGDLKI